MNAPNTSSQTTHSVLFHFADFLVLYCLTQTPELYLERTARGKQMVISSDQNRFSMFGFVLMCQVMTNHSERSAMSLAAKNSPPFQADQC